MAIGYGGQYGPGGRRPSMANDPTVRGFKMGGTQKPQPKAIASKFEVKHELKDAEVIGKIRLKNCTKIAAELLKKFQVNPKSTLGTAINSLCNGLANKDFNSDVFGKYDRDEGCFPNGDNECGTLQGKQLSKNDAMNVFFEFAKKNESFFKNLEENGGSITDIKSDFLSAANDVIGQFVMEESSKTSSSTSFDGKNAINWVRKA